MENFQTKTPDTIVRKADATGKLHLIEPTRQQLMVIFEHLQAIGAEEALLTDSKAINRAILSKWFQQLVIRNDLFPHDLPVRFVLAEFFEAIWQGRVERKGNNLAAHLKAFRIWIGGYEQSIRRRYFHQTHPAERQKALPEFSDAPDERADPKQTLQRMYKGDIPENLRKYAESEASEPPEPKPE